MFSIRNQTNEAMCDYVINKYDTFSCFDAILDKYTRAAGRLIFLIVD